jgi:Tfp pilus assembly protein FimT
MKNRGSSLIEIILVVAITAILFSVAMPMSIYLKQYDLDSAAYQLASDLRLVQQLSINTSIVENELSKDSVDQFPKLSVRRGDICGYIISRGLTTIKSITFSENVKVVGEYQMIYFNNNGYINKPITIRLSSENKNRYVIIDRVGRIRVQ